ncbi:MAG: GtrA family protein [Bacilli bacterium]|nr:GtrA family protein [Bacilli bacterium]
MTNKKKNIKKLDKAFDEAFKMLNITDKKTQKLLIKIVKFVIVGGIATLISGVIFFLCDHFLKMSVLISNTIAFSISVVYNFWASCKYVFDVDKDKNRARIFTEFIVFALLGYFLTEVLLWLMADVMKWNHMLAWVIATVIVMVFNFVTRQIFLEKKATK